MIKNDRSPCSRYPSHLRNALAINGKKTDHSTRLFPTWTCDKKPAAAYIKWLNSFATGKPYEFGLHKRGRDYHFSLGWDGNRKYKTDKLRSLRLPGKELAIAAGTSKGSQIEVLIDSIEITRVSE